MVHRPADSRLLTNLLSHEKEYTKSISNLFDVSQNAIASFSAYASASAPPTSRVIVAVAGTLAGADAALHNYAVSVEQWQVQLKALKAAEDEVGNIIRDREILVSRLIKASKQQKSTRESTLGSSPSSSSLSFIPEVQLGTKMNSAQIELQACEAHLAAKERELEILRANTIRDGLQARCKAMVECGWTWGEMGKEGLRALESMDSGNGHGDPRSHPYPFHDARSSSDHAASDLSSIAPSQSASQIAFGSDHSHTSEPTFSPTNGPRPPAKAYNLHIPPAHSMSYFAVPGAHAPSPIFEDPGAGSSEEDEDVGPLEVHENERFAQKGLTSKVSLNNRHVRLPTGSSSVESSKSDRSPTKRKDGERHRSLSLFGSIAAFLRKGSSTGTVSDDGSSNTSSKRWHTRIDKNVRRVGRDGDSSDEDVTSSHYRHASTLSASYTRNPGSSSPISPITPSASAASTFAGTPSQKRNTLKRSSVPVQTTTSEKGWVSDGVATTGSKKGKAKRNTGANGSALTPPNTASPSPKRRTASVDTHDIAHHAAADVKASLSRNSSLSKQSAVSAASAPARTPSGSTSKPVDSVSPIAQDSLPKRKRSTVSGPSPTSKPGPVGHKRSLSMSGPPVSRSGLTRANDEPSLMSIVENVARQSKEAWVKQDPNRMLVSVKAPPPINVSLELDKELSAPLSASTSTPSATPAKPTPRAAEKRPAQVPTKDKDHSMNRSSLSTSASAPSLSLLAQTPIRPPAAAKSPLRSALRNSSRSPSPRQPQVSNSPSLDAVVENSKPANGSRNSSPKVVRSSSVNSSPPATFYSPSNTSSPANPAASSPATFYSTYNTASPANTSVNTSSSAEFFSPTITSSPAAASVPLASAAEPGRRDSLMDDASSISSYETTQEVFDEDVETETEMPRPAPPPPPPSKDKPKPHLEGSDVSHNTDSSTSTAAPPTRRKSVRMSLPPTFSTTPPALDEDDESSKARYRPWGEDDAARPKMSNGWGTKIEENGTRDVWADSSDEDEDYSRAKRLLSRLSRRGVH